MNNKQKLMSEIMTLGYLINDMTEYCVFIRYSGHVDLIEIDIASSKKNYHNYVVESEAYQPSVERLEGIKENLLMVLQNKEIDTDNLDYDLKTIKKYKF